jgi:glucose/arabinose dehydrogenase
MKIIIPLILGALILTGSFFVYQIVNEERPGSLNQGVATNNQEDKVSIIAENLDVPWAVAFLPGGDILVTERVGRIQRIKKDGSKETVLDIDEVLSTGEGGLLGLTLHPDFTDNNYVYVYYTYSSGGSETFNRVVRYQYQDNDFTGRQIIVDQIPGGRNHNGGRIKFGPDGFLYITTGDAQEASLAQDTGSLAGKILRVTDEGEPAQDNPFDNLVFAYGLRNPQGLTWVNNQLWATDHGAVAGDELNRISAGNNYGWPVISGSQEREGMETPVVQSGQDTWAPAGLVHHKGIFYFAGLRGRALYSFDPDNPQNGVGERFKNQFGRLRDVVIGPDGQMYITTSNRDGRGTADEGDDKILCRELSI